MPRERTSEEQQQTLKKLQERYGHFTRIPEPFLTRLGYGSHMVITGDVTQIDLPKGKKSGLIEAQRLLIDIPEIGMVTFSEQDVVRHPLVQKIILAYNRDQQE